MNYISYLFDQNYSNHKVKNSKNQNIVIIIDLRLGPHKNLLSVQGIS